MEKDRSSGRPGNQSEGRLNLEDSLRLVRLRRMVDQKSLPESLARQVKNSLQISGAELVSQDQVKWHFENLGTRQPDVKKSAATEGHKAQIEISSESSASLHQKDHSVDKKDTDYEKLDGIEPPSDSLSLSLDPSDLGLERAELSLRRLIVARSDWVEMQQHAWKIYDKWKRPEIAAKIAEIAYVHGKLEQFLNVLEILLRDNRSFYFMIQKSLRDHMVLRLWVNKKESVLNHFLHQKFFRSYLIPIEHLFVFWSLYGGAHPRSSYDYYKRYMSEITRALHDSGQALKLKPSYFYFVVGRLSHEFGDKSEARRLLEKVDRNDNNFRKALDLLVEFDAETDSGGLNAYERKLTNERNWPARIKVLEGFLIDCEKIEGVKHRERASLNQILSKPLQWFPENYDAWNQLSELLLRFVNIDFLLPNITKLFDDHVLQFYTPSMDRAIWTPVSSIDCDDPFKADYYRSLSWIHEYISGACKRDELIWQARDLYIQVERSGKYRVPLTWRDLHRKLLSFVSKSSRYEESERERIISSLKLAAYHTDVDSSEIEAFLQKGRESSGYVLRMLQDLAAQREDAKLEAHLIRGQVKDKHHDNSQLARLWALARSLGDKDLAWRVASILKSRKSLSHEVERFWLLSFETRKDFPLKSFSSTQLGLILEGLPEQGRSFVEAITVVGPLIPELLSYLTNDVKSSRRVSSGSGFERSIEDLMRSLTVFPQAKKTYCWHSDQGGPLLPIFAQSLPHNRWVQLLLEFAERFGFHAWRWRVSLLNSLVDSLFVKIQSSGGDAHLPSKVGKWLRQLSPLQRKAWYQLGTLCRQMSDEKASVYAGMMLSRLTSCVLNQNSLALDSLAAMDVPIAIRWDLENFFLSENYSELRRQLRVLHHLDIPAKLSSDPRNLG